MGKIQATENQQTTADIQWVQPRKWVHLGALAFQLPGLPDQEFTLIFPEWFAARETSWHAACRWDMPPTTGVWENDSSAAVLQLKFACTKRAYTLEWTCDFENRGDQTLTDLFAFNCFNLNGAPLFKDLTMERTWGSNREGEAVPLSKVAKTRETGKRTMQFYAVARGMELSRIAKIHAYGVTSPACLSGDRLGIYSKDGQWLVETIVDGPVAFFFNNWETDHGCVHASPWLGTLAPGDTSTATGRIVFTRLPCT